MSKGAHITINGLRGLLCNLASLCDAWKAGEPETWTTWDQEQRERITEYVLGLEEMGSAAHTATIQLFSEGNRHVIEMSFGSRGAAETIFEMLDAIATEASPKGAPNDQR